LRSAIKLANVFHGVINIPAGTYNIAGSLLIDQPSGVEFKGSGHETTTIDGSGADRILWVSHINANVAMRDPDNKTLRINDSVIRNNAAGFGGGISVFSNGTLTLEDSPISGSLTKGNGGGLYVEGVAFLRHVTLTGNTGLSGDALSDCANGLTGFGANIISSASSCTISGGTIIDLDPLLAGLDDNGGPTLTHMPAVNSPAVDAIECFLGESTDQRG
jgi:hypothetical protein